MGCNGENIKTKRRFMLLALVMMLALPAFLILVKNHWSYRDTDDADVMNKKAISRELFPGNGDEAGKDRIPAVKVNANNSDKSKAEYDNTKYESTNYEDTNYDNTNYEDTKYEDTKYKNTEYENTEYKNNTISHETQKFIYSLKLYVSGLDGCYGVYFIDLNSGLEFGINENEVFYAASTVKVPLALYLGVLMENGMVQPNEVVEYIETDYESGSGKLQFEKYGSKYTVRELVGLSIRISDNVATNMLLRTTGHQNLKDFMRSLGGEVVDDERNLTCPKDMAIYLKKAYDFSRNSDYGKELIYELQNTVFNDRLPVRLPGSIKVAHKIGNWVNSYHDIGIIFTENPYVVSIMSKEVYEKDAFSEIAHISWLIFDFFSRENFPDDPP